MKLPPDSRDFLELLNSHDVRYVIVGGWAVALHGHPRYTGDIDFFVECSPENAEKLLRVLEAFNPGAFGFTATDLQEPNMCFQLGIEPQRIDLLTFAEGIDFESAWQSRQEILLDGVRAWMVSRELLIKNKIASGRAQDLADVEKLNRRKDHRPTF